MKILVVGGGGREQAIAWALRKDSRVKKVFLAPGNAGTLFMRDVVQNIPISSEDVKGLLSFAKQERVDYTVVGPELPLEKGIVDAFDVSGMPIVGPSQAAAKLETSKAFAKSVMQSANIPTADFQTFSDYKKAQVYVKAQTQFPLVLKASGIAAGKGVIIAKTLQEAEEALSDMFEKKVFGTAGDEVIVEEFMQGEEASIFAITDGNTYKLFSPAQDHKRIGEGDTGKNTGGMGAYAPAPIASPDVINKTKKLIIEPLLEEMAKRGIPYKGILYVGLMVAQGDPRVVEFNARLGDPETQAVLPLLETSFCHICESMIHGQLSNMDLSISKKSSATVVLTSAGYPDAYEKGKVIHLTKPFELLLERYSQVKNDLLVFHSGTEESNGILMTSGGRVLSVTAVAETLKDSLTHAYSKIQDTQFEGAYYRKDIGYRALKD